MSTPPPPQITEQPLLPFWNAPGGVTMIDGKIVRQIMEKPSGWRMLLVEISGKKKPEKWMGVCDRLEDGAEVQATGRYEKDRRNPDQDVFLWDTLIEQVPQTTAGLVSFLSRLVPGVKKGLATRIIVRFGAMTVDVLDKDPQQLALVPGINADKAIALGKAWADKRATAAVILALLNHGVLPHLARRIAEHFEDRAMHILEHEPYRLTEVDGLGFLRADEIAQKMGIGQNSVERAEAATVHVIDKATFRDGHCVTPETEVIAEAVKLIGVPPSLCIEAIQRLLSAERPRIRREDGRTPILMLSKIAKAEEDFAIKLAKISTSPLNGNADDADAPLATRVDSAIAAFEESAEISLAPAQKEAIALAASEKLLVITGGPGVGKSTILLGIMELFQSAKIPVYLCAPTGRAAKRMNEATHHPASTIHRMLGFDPKEKGFLFRAGRPMPNCGAVVIDESSMVDVKLAADVIAAIPDGARLIWMGDEDQLPSVGPGAVLRDMISAKSIKTVRLTQIFRQAKGSAIIDNAHRINRGEAPIGDTSPNGEFYVFHRDDGAAAAALAVELVTKRIPAGFGIAPTDIQVLTPRHKGDAGTIEINHALQENLNPLLEGQLEMVRGDTHYRVKDKVLHTKNDAMRNVFNGDLGVVHSIVDLETGDRQLVVRFDDDREISYTAKQLDALKLAYAMSTHKSQGSTFTAVVQLLMPEHSMMLSRPLVYTGVTRPRRLAVLITQPQALRRALRETQSAKRRTRLADMIRDRIGSATGDPR